MVSPPSQSTIHPTSDSLRAKHHRNEAAPRTLLLAPPSISAHPESLSQVTAAYDRNATDIQMLDRLAIGLVALPSSTYDIVLLLTDVDGSREESGRLLNRGVMERIVTAMLPGGRLMSQDGTFGRNAGPEQTEAILSGLVADDGEEWNDQTEVAAVRANCVTTSGKQEESECCCWYLPNNIEAVNIAKRKSEDISNGHGNGAQTNVRGPLQTTPAGVGFIDTTDDFDGGYDDGYGYESDDMDIPSNEELARAEKIDPDSLLTEEDRRKPLIIRKCYGP